ncbi:DUF6083 domain-containing protein [Streptomyces tsukubensis]|uniref:DUF6083 domain-containing protein n=1 Tax=Streptomyces tsukubensis TaxID=83656 RepID=UPI001D03C878|nr:DUF6083 domain-containing protein [Streptomyces tsukubensis]
MLHVRRSFQVNPDSASWLLRFVPTAHCRDCGNRIEWYHRSNDRPVGLHTRELPSFEVPAAGRWNVSSGFAHPAGDGSATSHEPRPGTAGTSTPARRRVASTS